MAKTKMDSMMLVLLVCIIATSSITYSKENDVHCLFPGQWESEMFFDIGIMDGILEQMSGRGRYYYDHPNKQMRADMVGRLVGNDYLGNSSVIWRFLENIIYSIDHNTHTCEWEEGDVIDMWRQWDGVPGDATWTYSGVVSLGRLAVNQYSLVRNTNDGDAVITIDTVYGSVCRPIRLTIQDLNLDPDAGEMVSYEFLDHGRLTDHTVFTPPPNCTKGTSTHTGTIRKLLSRRFIGLFSG